VPDAHVATLMRKHGVATVNTRDRRFLSYEGTLVRNPFS
jgi:hypothetical protein